MVVSQVNASPSLTTTTESDRIMKTCLLRDIYAVVAPGVPAIPPEYARKYIYVLTYILTNIYSIIHN